MGKALVKPGHSACHPFVGAGFRFVGHGVQQTHVGAEMKCREHEDSREKAGHQFKVQGQVAPFFQGRGSFLCQGGDGGPEVIIYSFILVLFCQGIFKNEGEADL